MKAAWIGAVWFGLAFAGCRCGGQSVDQARPDAAPLPSARLSASASASARPLRSTRPAPKPENVSFETSDGVKIEGSLYVGGDARSPAVVVAHRLAGTRAEWVPLVERIFPPKSPFNVLAIDLRGHGGSVGTGKGAKGNKKQLGWNELAPGDFAAMSKDVQAAIQWMDRRSGGPASSVVLMGSDIGSTAVTVASKGLGVRLRGLALVSPGAALRGVDLYKPFGEVLLLPNLIVAATMDNTSAEPAQALQAMSKSSRLVRLDGSLHSAEYLGRDRPMVWDELADWLEERVTASASPPAVPSASTSK